MATHAQTLDHDPRVSSSLINTTAPGPGVNRRPAQPCLRHRLAAARVSVIESNTDAGIELPPGRVAAINRWCLELFASGDQLVDRISRAHCVTCGRANGIAPFNRCRDDGERVSPIPRAAAGPQPRSETAITPPWNGNSGCLGPGPATASPAQGPARLPVRHITRPRRSPAAPLPGRRAGLPEARRP